MTGHWPAGAPSPTRFMPPAGSSRSCGTSGRCGGQWHLSTRHSCRCGRPACRARWGAPGTPRTTSHGRVFRPRRRPSGAFRKSSALTRVRLAMPSASGSRRGEPRRTRLPHRRLLVEGNQSAHRRLGRRSAATYPLPRRSRPRDPRQDRALPAHLPPLLVRTEATYSCADTIRGDECDVDRAVR